MITKLNSPKHDLSFIVVANIVHGIFEVETEAEAIELCGGSEGLDLDDFKDSLDTFDDFKGSLDALGENRAIWCKVDLVELAQLHDKYGVDTIRPIYAALYLDPHNGFQADLSKHFYTEEEAINFINTERPRIIREKYDGDEDKFYTDVYASDYAFTKIGQ